METSLRTSSNTCEIDIPEECDQAHKRGENKIEQTVEESVP